MADVARRTYVRSDGPQPVISRRTSESSRSPIKISSHKSKHEHHRHRSSKIQVPVESSYYATYPVQEPIREPTEQLSKFHLAIMGPPPSVVQAGAPFEPSIMISHKNLRRPSRHNASHFVAVATLLIESSTGAQIPLPSGYLQGSRLFDNMHSLPESYLDQLPRDMRESALGYVSFPELRIVRAGVYRVRVSLMRVADAGATRQDAVTVGTVDSALIKVFAASTSGQGESHA